MKKIICQLGYILCCIIYIIPTHAQTYDIEKIKTISEIWGKVYLFHPSIIQIDKKKEWEQELVTFLPSIKENMTEDDFIEILNKKLLSTLDDRFTRVQKIKKNGFYPKSLPYSKEFDYLRLDETHLSAITSLALVDSLITDRNSQKPLVIDVRICTEIKADYHILTFFEYFLSMFITAPLPLGQQVTREHFGWDEWNDWWFYEQRWKIHSPDRQGTDGNWLKPLSAYVEELNQYLPEFDFTNFTPIQRPLYLLTNNSFLSYYEPLLNIFAAQKSDIEVLNENRGTIFASPHSGLIEYPLSSSYTFILNTSFSLINGQAVKPVYQDYDQIDNKILIKTLHTHFPESHKTIPISLAISPHKYISPFSALSSEEKILGIIKIQTIFKYFHQNNILYAKYLDDNFNKYVELAFHTQTDKAYYELLKEMLSPLNDSHISFFHPSIVDFSAMYVAPINFEWIEDQMVITAVSNKITKCQVGDIISDIDNLPVNQILALNQKQISHSNRQGLLATVIHPGNFAGRQGTNIMMKVNGKNVVLPRTVPIWEMKDLSRKVNSQIYEGNIGYLNLSVDDNARALKGLLERMRNTQGLIIDLRNSYPYYDFYDFLRMLCLEPVTTRIAEVPIVTAGKEEIISLQKNRCTPDPDFTYKGKIAVLIDKTVMSRPEDIAIALSSFPNVIFIGEQTQGTDGEISKIHLPGNGEISFTGQRIKFGNGKDFQGIGILPDLPVKKTIEGIKNNRDEILECALEYLKRK